MEKIKVKNKYLFKNKTQMVIYLAIFIILISLFIYLGDLEYHPEISDNVRFHEDFPLVDVDNVFSYVNSQDAYNDLYNSKAIILFGFKNNEWVNYYANIVNEVAIEEGIEKIDYYDFLDDRNGNFGTYEAIVDLLGNYATFDDLGNSDIYAPTLVVMDNHRIVYFDNGTAFRKGQMNPDEYWTEYRIQEKKSELEVVFKNYLGS